MSKKMPELHNWSIQYYFANPYTAPELISSILTGQVYGHHCIDDGKDVITSFVKKLYITTRGYRAQTKNTIYKLMNPDPKFLEYIELIHRTLHDYFISKEM